LRALVEGLAFTWSPKSKNAVLKSVMRRLRITEIVDGSTTACNIAASCFYQKSDSSEAEIEIVKFEPRRSHDQLDSTAGR